ncbi:MAG: PaaI family thioesterase [Pseudomonadota bacterium]
MTITDPVATINAHRSPTVISLGGRAIAYDSASGRLELAFDVADQFANRANAVQGGIVAAMLDAAMGVAAAVGHAQMTNVPTLDISVSYLRATPLGELRCIGEIVRASRRVVFAESSLCTPDGVVTARGRSTLLLPAESALRT